jgi:hypothetical protein
MLVSNEGVERTPERAEANRRARHEALARLHDHLDRHPEQNAYGRWKRANAKRAHMRVAPMPKVRPPASMTTVHEATAPRRTNGSSGKPRAEAARPSAKSGDSGDDDPAPPPRGDGAARLLRALARRGLSPAALPVAAALVLELDRLGTGRLRHISYALDAFLAALEDVAA